MAVERKKEFIIDLGDLVKTQLNDFVKSRQRIHALEETNFQRNIIDNDLSYQEQLDYRIEQLKKEKENKYPDNDFIEEIKTSISNLKKMVRQRKFRDEYFSLLQDLASGNKSLENHLSFLQDSILDESLDREIKDQLQEELIKVTEAKRTQDRNIINSQITFYQKDRTSDSINEAIDIVKKQLLKPDIQRDEVLRNSYEMQLKTLNKEKREVEIEDKANWMVMTMIKQEKPHPSLWKINTFADFRNNADVDNPINVGLIYKILLRITILSEIIQSFKIIPRL